MTKLDCSTKFPFAALVFYRDVDWSFYAGILLAGSLQTFGITAGIHRLWSHRSYTVVLPIRILLSLFTMASWQGSIKWWVLRHRMHHRWTDTERDPYDSRKGLWFAHCGWLFERPTYYEYFSKIDISDLDRDPVVRHNSRWYPSGVIVLGLILPAVWGYLLGDTMAGFLFIGVLARVFSWNAIFAINSWAHWQGSKTYNKNISAVGNLLCAIVSMGEGNHNYHHEFPSDFRHGYRLFDWDPTKWAILLWEALGWASHCRRTGDRLVREAVVRQVLEAAQEDLGLLMKGRETLPTWTKIKFISQKGHPLVMLDGYGLDLSDFILDHPGGAKLLLDYHGKDVSQEFHGGLNSHTPSAENLAARYRICQLKK
jgi:stearoyl-CoA desaturase (delta-9 desaturase)